MRNTLSSLAFLSALIAALTLAQGRAPAPARFAEAEYRQAAFAPAAPLFERRFIYREGPTAKAHSGTLLELDDGGLMAAWFGGSREGARDVAILAARWNGGDWSPPFVLTDRQASERELGRGLKKLGNPVLHRDRQGELWLFYVTVSTGGWSTSSISYKRSSDGGHSWQPARRLVSSPFANLSTLVRTRPLDLADGGMALPVYHELAGKFGELLRLDPNGRILSKARMGGGRSAIQPSLVARGPEDALALLRRVGNSPRQVLLSRSDDGGANWSALQSTELPNPDASVAALNSGDGGILLVYNPNRQGRNRLSLAHSPDGIHWRGLAELENGAADEEFSYPYLIRGRSGDYHLIYTWRRERMVHLRFNQAWLERLP
jgi:predicted neuraminidase